MECTVMLINSILSNCWREIPVTTTGDKKAGNHRLLWNTNVTENVSITSVDFSLNNWSSKIFINVKGYISCPLLIPWFRNNGCDFILVGITVPIWTMVRQLSAHAMRNLSCVHEEVCRDHLEKSWRRCRYQYRFLRQWWQQLLASVTCPNGAKRQGGNASCPCTSWWRRSIVQFFFWTEKAWIINVVKRMVVQDQRWLLTAPRKP